MIAPNSDSPDHPMLFASAAALGFNAPSAMRPMGRTCAPTMGEAEDLQLLVSRFGPTSQEQQHSRRSALQATSCGLCSGRGARSRRPSAYRGAPTPGGRRRRRTVWPTACQLGVPRAFPRPSATRAAAERTCAPRARGPPRYLTVSFDRAREVRPQLRGKPGKKFLFSPVFRG